MKNLTSTLLLILFFLFSAKAQLTNRSLDSLPCNPLIGTGHVVQPGTSLQQPTLFGNYNKSHRSQLLYTAAEVSAALSGADLIQKVYFNAAVFNSNAYLSNFEIKMGLTASDSLADWQNGLTTVFGPSTVPQSSGWGGGFQLSTPFQWDGHSNLVVDICANNPTTFGNQLNKFECTITPHTSYLYSAGDTSQCGGTTVPFLSTTRPNIKFQDCSVPAGVQEINDNASNIRLYPNPATDQLFIETSGEPVTGINIYNTTGSLVMAVQTPVMGTGVSIATLDNGVYIAEIKAPKSPKGDFNTVIKRFIKM